MTAPKPKPYTASLRWPLQPLLDHGRVNTADLQKLGIPGGTIYDAASRGLTDVKADECATLLGLHPSLIWDGWDEAALLPSDDLFVNGSTTASPGWRQAWEWAEARTYAPEIAPVATEAPETMREAA